MATKTLPYAGSLQLYLKLGPPANNTPSSTPAWDDEVDLFYSPVAKVVAFTGLLDGQTYWVYEAQSNNTPLATDPLFAQFSTPATTDTPPSTAQIVTAINADATQTTARTNAATAATQATTAATQSTTAASLSTAIKAKTDLIGTIRSLIRW